MSNHVSRFYTAVTVLAGHGRIKQRLIEAFDRNLSHIESAELPVPVRKSFLELKAMMSQVAPLNGEGATCASVRKMSKQEADDCAHKIIDLYGDMIRFGDDAQEVLPLVMDEETRVPAFLAKAN